MHELDNASISPGSQFITAANARGGCADWGVTTLNNATATLFTIAFSYTLASAPTAYDLTFMGPTGNAITIGGNPLVDQTSVNKLTQFQIQLNGPIGDAVHSVHWKAFL